MPTLTLNFVQNVFFAASARIVLDVVLSETIVLDRASRNPYKIRVFTPRATMWVTIATVIQSNLILINPSRGDLVHTPIKENRSYTTTSS